MNNKPNEGIYLQTLASLRQCQHKHNRPVTINELMEYHTGYTRAAIVYHLRRLAEWDCVEIIRQSVSNRYFWRITEIGGKAISSGRLPDVLAKY